MKIKFAIVATVLYSFALASSFGKGNDVVFDSLYALAKKQWRSHNLTSAAGLALQYAIAGGSVEDEAKARYLMGYIDFQLENNQHSLTNLLVSLKLYGQLADSTMIASARNTIAGIYYRAAEYQEAISVLKAVYDQSPLYQDSSSRLRTLRELGQNYAKLDQFDSAKIYFIEAQKYVRTNEEQAKLWNVEARTLLYEGYPQRAIKLFQQVCELPDVSNSRLAFAYGSLGSSYSIMGKWQRAIQWNKQAMSLFENVANEYDYTLCGVNLAKAHAAVGNIGLAKGLLIELSEQAAHNGLPPELKLSINSIKVEIEGLIAGNDDLVLYAAEIAQEAQASKGIAEKLAIERAKRQVEQGEHAFEIYAAEQKEKQLWKRQLIYWGLAAVVLVVIGLLIYRKYRAMDKKMLHLSLARKLTASGEAYRIPKDWDLKV